MANLFSDGFESGDLSAWTSSSTDGGDLSVVGGSLINGTYCAAYLLDDATQIYVYDETPNNVKRYRARVYFDPNTFNPQGETALFQATGNSTSGTMYYLLIDDAGSGGTPYRATVKCIKDSGDVSSTPYQFSDAIHWFEVDWKASSAPGANDGFCKLYMDSTASVVGEVTGVDNDTKAVGGIWVQARYHGAGSTGTFYIDDFASNDDGTAIGAVGTLYQATLTGALTFSGTLNKKVSRIHTGAFVATGELNKIIRQVLVGAVSFTGTLVKKISQTCAGAISFIGAFTGALAGEAEEIVHVLAKHLRSVIVLIRDRK